MISQCVITPQPTMVFKILCWCCFLLCFVQQTAKADFTAELEYIDSSVDPCEDFYKFTCGNFENVQTLPENESVWDNFAILQKEIFTLIKTILLTERGGDEPVALQKAKAAYQSCVDLEYVEQLELAEKSVLEKLGGWPLIGATLGQQKQKSGGFTWKEIGNIAGEYGISLLFTFSITQNLLNANENVILFSEDKLSDPTIRMAPDVLNMEKEVKFDSSAFQKFAKNIARRLRKEFGGSKTDRDIEAEIVKVIEFTEQLDAGGVVEDDAVYDNISTFVTIEALQNWTDTFFARNELQLNWLEYFNSIFKLSGAQVTNTTRIMRSASTDSIYGVLNLVRQTDPLILKNFVIVRVLTYTAPDSDSYMRQAFEEYYVEQLGEKMQTRDDYCLYKVLDYPNIGLSLALAHEYQKFHFNINKLSLAAEMVQDLQNAFLDVIEESEWMDNSTKLAATNKAKEMITLLAYPDFVEDEEKLDDFYENLRVCSWDHFGNSQRLRAFSKALDYSAVSKERDRELWNYSPLYTNALYSRQHNRMLFPIAMLNPVFFNGDIRVLDYARIGAIIGHEITHGFDSTGRYYNHEGTYGSSWWTADAANTFKDKEDCFIRQYSQYYVDEIDAYVDGSLSLDENIADNGGLKDAYGAFKKLAFRRRAALKTTNNYTLDQLFFIGFGTMWCSQETEGYLNTIVKSKYAPARFRVNGAVSNMEAFAEAFSCPVGSQMNPAEKCSLW